MPDPAAWAAFIQPVEIFMNKPQIFPTSVNSLNKILFPCRLFHYIYSLCHWFHFENQNYENQQTFHQNLSWLCILDVSCRFVFWMIKASLQGFEPPIQFRGFSIGKQEAQIHHDSVQSIFSLIDQPENCANVKGKDILYVLNMIWKINIYGVMVCNICFDAIDSYFK